RTPPLRKAAAKAPAASAPAPANPPSHHRTNSRPSIMSINRLVRFSTTATVYGPGLSIWTEHGRVSPLPARRYGGEDRPRDGVDPAIRDRRRRRGARPNGPTEPKRTGSDWSESAARFEAFPASIAFLNRSRPGTGTRLR